MDYRHITFEDRDGLSAASIYRSHRRISAIEGREQWYCGCYRAECNREIVMENVFEILPVLSSTVPVPLVYIFLLHYLEFGKIYLDLPSIIHPICKKR